MHFEVEECTSTDLQGPFEVFSATGKKYFLSFTDKASGYITLYFTCTITKGEIVPILKEYISCNRVLTGKDQNLVN
jgi:hypothetical protein